MKGSELITKERDRQVYEEGFNSNHDSWHLCSELAVFAACYALDVAAKNGEVDIKLQAKYAQVAGELLPSDREWWKPELNPVKQLAKAGALIAAEIDRIQQRSKR